MASESLRPQRDEGGPTLAELFERHRQGRSIASLMDVAARGGFWIPSETSWRQWADARYARKDIPTTQTIKAFAAGLGVTEREVLLAVGRSVGLSVEPDSEVDLVIPGAGVLGHADREVLASMASLLVSKMEG